MTRSGDDPAALLLSAREAASSRYRAILAKPGQPAGFRCSGDGKTARPVPARGQPALTARKQSEQ